MGHKTNSFFPNGAPFVHSSAGCWLKKWAWLGSWLIQRGASADWLKTSEKQRRGHHFVAQRKKTTFCGRGTSGISREASYIRHWFSNYFSLVVPTACLLLTIDCVYGISRTLWTSRVLWIWRTCTFYQQLTTFHVHILFLFFLLRFCCCSDVLDRLLLLLGYKLMQ